jgi:hypothetical protein
MKTAHLYRWRYFERGRTHKTRYVCTWEDICEEHPDAEPIEGTLELRQVPETDEERAAVILGHSTQPPQA